MPSPAWLHEQNILIRISGQDPPVSQIVAEAGAQIPGCEIGPTRANGPDDYAQIDPELTFAAPEAGERVDLPDRQLGYAAFSPLQRHHFLNWLDDPAQPGPVAFHTLYLAMLEVRLFESERLATAAHAELLRLHLQEAWHDNQALTRVLMLAFWLRQDGELLANWLDTATMPIDLLGTALGWQALLNRPITPGQATTLIGSRQDPKIIQDEELVALHLTSLPAALGAEPLQYSLDQLDDEAHRPTVWRTVHRDLHISLPQPNLAPVLIPILVDMVANDGGTRGGGSTTTSAVGPMPGDDLDWTLVLEFGQSRSEYFDFALQLAQRNQNFTQIMDENRNLVYRIIYKKGRLRDFWRIWDYVQGWSMTRVYINGEEMEKWKIWPYSQYLR